MRCWATQAISEANEVRLKNAYSKLSPRHRTRSILCAENKMKSVRDIEPLNSITSCRHKADLPSDVSD